MSLLPVICLVRYRVSIQSQDVDGMERFCSSLSLIRQSSRVLIAGYIVWQTRLCKLLGAQGHFKVYFILFRRIKASVMIVNKLSFRASTAWKYRIIYTLMMRRVGKFSFLYVP